MSKLIPWLVALSASVAHASPLSPLPAAPGVETATIEGPIPWCHGVIPGEPWSEAQIAEVAATDDGLFVAAYQLCQRPQDAMWKRTARNLLQRWINTAKQPQKDAINSIRARLDPDKVSAELAALCSSVDRLAGLVREIAGCPVRGYAPVELYLDRRGFRYELQKLYWAYRYLDDIPSYVLLERDFPISHAKLEREVSESAFAENAYIRARVSEALSTLEWRKRRLEMQVSTDPDAAFMREVVDRAYLEWDTLASTHRDDLAVIDAVDARLPMTREALAGCSIPLDTVFERRLASYKTKKPDELEGRMLEDPLAALVLSRLAICHAVDDISDAAYLVQLVQRAPMVAGPRSYAAHVLAKALAKANMRGKIARPIAPRDFFAYAPESRWLGGSVELLRGVASEVTPTATGVRVTLEDGTVAEISRRFATKVAPGARLAIGSGGMVIGVVTSSATPEVLAYLGYPL